jgi:signal transduction histidine kinase
VHQPDICSSRSVILLGGWSSATRWSYDRVAVLLPYGGFQAYAFQDIATAAGVSIGALPVPSPALAVFDHARILQVLTNLLGNAIKFTPSGGRVVVTVERIGEVVRVSVTDSGVGVAPERLEAVFERFLQLKPNDRRGVGLGLYISRCIVERHGGRIWAESTIGEGSTFSFTLPVPIAP